MVLWMSKNVKQVIFNMWNKKKKMGLDVNRDKVIESLHLHILTAVTHSYTHFFLSTFYVLLLFVTPLILPGQQKSFNIIYTNVLWLGAKM